MHYLKTPIHGDRVYGKAADRLYLHAKELEITIPISNRHTFSVPTPPEFEQFFDE
jgi:23S rRNA-/tRNA-specific pseudouridylate synthase